MHPSIRKEQIDQRRREILRELVALQKEEASLPPEHSIGELPMTNGVTTAELSEALKVSYGVIARWRTLGMPYVSISRRDGCYYDFEEVQEWLKRFGLLTSSMRWPLSTKAPKLKSD